MQPVGDGIEQAALFDDVLNKGRKGLRLEGISSGQVGNDAGGEVHTQLIAGANLLHRFVTFQDGKADIDGVAVENAGEAGGDDTGNAGRLDGDGGVFPGGAAAEVLLGHNDVAGLHFGDKVFVDVLHAVGRQLFVGRGVEIPGGDNYVGIHIVAVFMDKALNLHIDAPPLYFRRIGDETGHRAGRRHRRAA